MNLYDRLKEIETRQGYKLLSMDYGEGNFLIYINDETKTVNIEYPTIAGIAYLSMHINEQREHDYEIGIGQTVRKRLTHKKGLERLGSTKRETLHSDLGKALQESKLLPDIAGYNYDQAGEWLLNTIQYQMSQQDIKVAYDEYTKIWLAQAIHEGKQAFFEEEDYDLETQRIASEVLLTNNVLNTFLKVMKLRVVGQHSQLLLKFLAGLSSALPTPLNTIAIGDSSSGKTWTEDTVYDLFPSHRKLKLDADTTKNSIMRMTSFQEGKHIFKRKWLYLGDYGDAEEFKRAAELLSVMKVLMSEQSYRKGVAEKDPETGEIKAEILELEGCGSISMQLVTTNIEAQFGNRTVFWSPLDTNKSRRMIREYQEQTIKSDFKRHMFDKQRKALSCAIDNIFRYVEHLETDGKSFKIYNPFLHHMGDKYDLDMSPNVNRDRLMMNMIPSLVTLANCYNRELYYNEEIAQFVLIVTPNDYIYCIENMSNVLSSFRESLALSLYKYVEILDEKIIPKLNSFESVSRKTLQINIENDDDSIDGVPHFTLNDVKQYTNISDTTLREKLELLADLGLLVKDDRKKTHFWLVPSDYEDAKKQVFIDDDADTESDLTEVSAERPKIEKIYADFMEELKEYGYVPSPSEVLSLTPAVEEEGAGVTRKLRNFQK